MQYGIKSLELLCAVAELSVVVGMVVQATPRVGRQLIERTN